MTSELTFRGHETQPMADTYSPKPPKPWLAVTRPIRYILREQRLTFVLIGIAIATLGFTLLPSNQAPQRYSSAIFDSFPAELESSHLTHRPVYNERRFGIQNWNSGGKIPLGLKRKGKRIVVTGGAGFVGSHLVDRLMERGDSVIVVDNFFTGRKENVMHHFGNPRFEMIRHDVVEPLLLEVDQIYHLACPASPVHYKFNPVKTIKTNVVGTLNMLGLAKRVGARFLLTSTSEVYGDPLQHPQVETYWGNVNPIGVRSCYDEGKRTAETLTMDYHRGADVEVRLPGSLTHMDQECALMMAVLLVISLPRL
uniref:UDP-glucuronic acid decarboxylase 1 n=1 Tax=Cannabis sativa TaxID=3483 RepID=A0A803NQS3_CANSA